MFNRDQEPIIELVPEGLTKSTTLQKAQLVIFKEKHGERHLPLLINTEEYGRVYKSFVKCDFSDMASMERLADLYHIKLEAVFFSRNEDNSNMHTLLCLSRQDEMDADEKRVLCEDLPNGITAGLMMGAPFYIKTADFNRLYNKETRKGQVAIPLAAMSEDLLQEALEQAVDGDNFELASLLRDEIKKRDANAAQ